MKSLTQSTNTKGLASALRSLDDLYNEPTKRHFRRHLPSYDPVVKVS